MAALLTLAEAKEHCRIRADDTSQDNALARYMDAATLWVQNYLNTANPPQNPDIKSAALLMVESLFRTRGAYTEKQMYENKAIDALLYPYRQDIGI